MSKSLSQSYASRVALFVIGLAIFVLSGCDVQNSEAVRTGSLHVTYLVGDSLVPGARIRLDGHQTSRLTPATLTGLSLGTHRVSAYKPGFVDTTLTVEIGSVGVDSALLYTARAQDGAINLLSAPAGTVLLVNNMQVDTVPVSDSDPTLFPNIGLGTFEVSAYLPGHTTELPAKWTVQISPGSTVTLSPVFVPGDLGVDVDDLAPPFELRSDWDSTLYRLQDFRGHVCLVNFFFYNCSACAEEFPYIASVYKDPLYAGKIEFFGIDFVDPYAKFAQYRADHEAFGLTFPLLHDPRQSAKTDYGVFNCPANYIVDPTGRVRLVQGAITEALLRQTMDDALHTANSATFSFTMDDTLVNYTQRDSSYEFIGTVLNRLNAARTFIHMVTPVSFPDTARNTSVCIGRLCYLPRAGSYGYDSEYQPSELDTLKLTIYNMSNDSTGIPLPDSIHGDYSVDLTVYPADNVSERITHRVYLRDAAPGSVVENSPFTRVHTSPFDLLHNR